LKGDFILEVSSLHSISKHKHHFRDMV